MVLYPNKLPESERVCFGICTLPTFSLVFSARGAVSFFLEGLQSCAGTLPEEVLLPVPCKHSINYKF